MQKNALWTGRDIHNRVVEIIYKRPHENMVLGVYHKPSKEEVIEWYYLDRLNDLVDFPKDFDAYIKSKLTKETLLEIVAKKKLALLLDTENPTLKEIKFLDDFYKEVQNLNI